MAEMIKKKKDGSYYFRANLGYDRQGKKIQKYKSGFKTKKEAREAYSKLIYELDIEKNIEQHITFEEFTEKYFLPWYKGRVKPQTFDQRMNHIKNYLTYFNGYKIHEIKPIDIQNWQIAYSERLQALTMKMVQNLLSMIIDRAIALEVALNNPTQKIGNRLIEKREMKIWAKEEFEKVVNHIDTEDYFGHHMFVVLWMLFMTGIRVGEACALQWEDVDLKNGHLIVNKTLVYKNRTNFRFSTPKTKASNRTVVLDKTTIQVLKEWKLIQKDYTNTKFVLSSNCYPTTREEISKAISKYSKEINIHRIRIHDLRHSHDSLLINLGENPLIIKERLGHCDVKTTLGTYGHLYPSAHHSVVDKLTNLVSI